MRVIVWTLLALAMLANISAQAAPVPGKAHPHKKGHETPAENVWKSRQYDHLVSTNAAFRSSRVKKECGPISDAALHSDCVASFGSYEPRR